MSQRRKEEAAASKHLSLGAHQSGLFMILQMFPTVRRFTSSSAAHAPPSCCAGFIYGTDVHVKEAFLRAQRELVPLFSYGMLHRILICRCFISMSMPIQLQNYIPVIARTRYNGVILRNPQTFLHVHFLLICRFRLSQTIKSSRPVLQGCRSHSIPSRTELLKPPVRLPQIAKPQWSGAVAASVPGGGSETTRLTSSRHRDKLAEE